NTIGGTSTFAGNIISFNPAGGAVSGATTPNPVAGKIIGLNNGGRPAIVGPAAANLVKCNIIGPHPEGDYLANTEGGVSTGCPDNTIGGTAPGAGNFIDASGAAGVSISGTAAQNNLVAGNFIGTNDTGAFLGNDLGIVIAGASNNTIGGTAPGAGNIIGFS